MTTNPPDADFDADGLLYSNRFGDHYFSRQDGRAECEHVFLAGNDLPHRWAEKRTFAIGELGFGTGLNFLETWHQWIHTRKPGQHLMFTSVEGFLLDMESTARTLSQWPELQFLAARLLQNWNQIGTPLSMDDQTTLYVIQRDVSDAMAEFPVTDAWYLDGFAPSKNPQMWSEKLMNKVGQLTTHGGTFASYTAAGWVRRSLEVAGFKVEKRPGFGTKRDMIAGVKA